jgi:hypothetical protein
MELNRQPRLLQFNKLTKAFITAISPVDPSWLNTEHYYYSEEVQFDQDHEVVVGNWDDWSIELIADQPFEVREDDLNILARERILKAYPMESQLNILGDLLEAIADTHSIECEELKAMNDYIDEVRRVNTLRKEFYKESPDYNYVSSEDFESNLRIKYEGAIDAYERSLLTD